MAKKVKFPLKMADGAQVRDLDELRSHFDLASVLSYYDKGKLAEWLVDRYYEAEAERIGALDVAADNFKKTLCEILGVKYSDSESDDVDMNAVAARNERLERLRSVTADDKILAAVDRVAFTQEDLADLLDEGIKEIYLCGNGFKIPGSVSGVTYIGVNNPKVDAPAGYIDNEIAFEFVDLGETAIDYNAKIATDLSDFVIEDGELVDYKGTATEILIPNCVDLIDESEAFDRIKAFHVNEDHEEFSAVDGVLFSKDMKTLVYYPTAKTEKNYTIPDTVVSNEGCFERNIYLEELTLQAGIIEIESWEFQGYEHIKSVILPPSVIRIGRNAFKGCKSLERINLDNVEVIGESAFEGCESLKSICLPGTMTYIGSYAFKDCVALKTITTTDSRRVDRVLTGEDEDPYFDASKALRRMRGETVYKRCPIRSSAFAECGMLEYVILPGGITEVESNAFLGCHSLESVVMNGVFYIYEDAFHDCYKLKTVSLPDEAEIYTKCLYDGKLVSKRIESRSGRDFAKEPFRVIF